MDTRHHHPVETDHATEVALKTIQRFHQIEHQHGLTLDTAKRNFAFLSAELDGERRTNLDFGVEYEAEKECKRGRSLFIFSENNLLRKAAKTLIDWGYPFPMKIF